MKLLINSWVGMIAIKTGRTKIHFLRDVFVAIASSDRKVPIVLWYRLVTMAGTTTFELLRSMQPSLDLLNDKHGFHSGLKGGTNRNFTCTVGTLRSDDSTPHPPPREKNETLTT